MGLGVDSVGGPGRALAPIRFLTLAASAGVGVLAAGYAFRATWATQTWPWQDSQLMYLFVGSILASIAAIGTWIGAVGEVAAFKTGGFALAVMFGGCAVYLFVRTAGGHGLTYPTGFAAVAVLAIGLALWSLKVPVRDERRAPVPVRVSFLLIGMLLTAAGIGLIARAQVFPWSIDERSSVLAGCISLGSASYFIASVLSSRWHHARGGLVALLAYDIALLPRYAQLPGENNPYGTPTNGVQLAGYLTFLSVSAVFSIYYLFVAQKTRTWGIQRPGTEPERS